MSTVDLAGARWRKSSFSSGTGGDNCVEVAFTGSAAALRDSKNANGPILAISTTAWHVLLGATK
jgi:hypothetical protein